MGAGPGSLWAGLGKRGVGKALEPGQRQERLGNSWAGSNLSDQASLVEENVQSVSRMGMPLQVLCLLNWGLGSQTLSQPRNSLKERPQAVFFLTHFWPNAMPINLFLIVLILKGSHYR